MLGIFKYFGFVILFGIGVGQTLLYRKLKKNWSKLPVVSATITKSKLLNHTGIDGNRVYEALIEFEYNFRGVTYRSKTPLLRSMQLFPDKDIEHELLAKYKERDLVNVRVVPSSPKNAFIEVQPFSRASAVGVPILAILYLLAVFGYGWVMVNIFNYESDFGDRVYQSTQNT